ncbi:hypothetical protein L485_16795 [Sphingobium baderi LL03]|uniref:Uncharacterized protein n=1 Tax=Sphingobium baderi LL03 TaxID=1114964 RepID=T0GEW6_9SPHN|nr:hypothetical protein L485_16795 [Sphingobium baderi LL03]
MCLVANCNSNYRINRTGAGLRENAPAVAIGK